jgi:hypothetical protein
VALLSIATEAAFEGLERLAAPAAVRAQGPGMLRMPDVGTRG